MSPAARGGIPAVPSGRRPLNTCSGRAVRCAWPWIAVSDGKAAAPVDYWRPGTDSGHSGQLPEAVDALERAQCRHPPAMSPTCRLGTFCSGGIDSSLVDRDRGSPPRGWPPSTRIQSVSTKPVLTRAFMAPSWPAACKSDHHEIRIDEAQFAGWLPKRSGTMTCRSTLPTPCTSTPSAFLAKERVKVVLTGEGADNSPRVSPLLHSAARGCARPPACVLRARSWRSPARCRIIASGASRNTRAGRRESACCSCLVRGSRDGRHPTSAWPIATYQWSQPSPPRREAADVSGTRFLDLSLVSILIARTR